jgi:hypothetical protein
MNTPTPNPPPVDLDEVINKIYETVEASPDELVVTIKLGGQTAKIVKFVSTLLQQTTDVNEEESFQYLLRAGAQREIEKLQRAYYGFKKLNDENANTQDTN